MRTIAAILAFGLSGALPTIWCGLKGWGKDAQRAVFQPFNLAVLSFALLVQAIQIVHVVD